MVELHELERERLSVQHRLDSGRSNALRNQLGQFATPPTLAEQIIHFALKHIENETEIRFLDPAFGTGAFYSAFLRSVNGNHFSATGIEIDSYYGTPAKTLWEKTGLCLRLDDFTELTPPTAENEKYNLLICNPPYVRHHHIDPEKKMFMKSKLLSQGLPLSGLAGLYCYFLLLADAWVQNGGISVWLIPNEFMDVNYGKTLKEYLVSSVDIIRIHRFNPEDVQFNDALVSSTIVVFRKKKPDRESVASLSFGGTLHSPKLFRNIRQSVLCPGEKWSRLSQRTKKTSRDNFTLGDLFTIKRGLATGNNDYFILTEERIHELQLTRDFLVPILPSPRFLQESVIETDTKGNPRIDQKLFLIDCNYSLETLRREFPKLWQYLQNGIEKGVQNGYICAHRSPWYSQEQRPPALFVSAYIGRNANHKIHPFRFVLNRSKATVTNSWLAFYPTPLFKDVLQTKSGLEFEILKQLNSISPELLIGEGRVYGGGMYKLEPKEMSRIGVDSLLAQLHVEKSIRKQRLLF